jgi:hypothetical protein
LSGRPGAKVPAFSPPGWRDGNYSPPDVGATPRPRTPTTRAVPRAARDCRYARPLDGQRSCRDRWCSHFERVVCLLSDCRACKVPDRLAARVEKTSDTSDTPPPPFPVTPALPPEARGRFAGRRAFLVGMGPSLESVDLAALRASDRVVVAINHAARWVRPDVWIGFDEPRHFDPSWWLDPGVLKVADARWRAAGRLGQVTGVTAGSQNGPTLAHECPNVAWVTTGPWIDPRRYWSGPVGWCRASTCESLHGAFRVLHDLGIVEVDLVGVDYRAGPGKRYAFDEPRKGRPPFHPGLERSLNAKYRKLGGHLAELAPTIAAVGLSVYNATEGSALEAFPARTLAEALGE